MEKFTTMKRAVLHLLLTSTFSLFLTVNAWADSSPAIPNKVKEHILKRHPQATDLQAREETHFGNKLLNVSYKDNEELNMELFRANGTLYSNVLLVEDPTPLPPAVFKALKTEFADYQFKKAEMVVNPNGVGEEYAMFVVVNGVNWVISINDKGQVLGKSNF